MAKVKNKSITRLLFHPKKGETHHGGSKNPRASTIGVDGQIKHIYIEENFVADCFAFLEAAIYCGIQIFNVPPSTVCMWLNYDLVGVVLTMC